MTKGNIIGRIQEQERLKAIVKSDRSEFVAVYGRRRVGKTYLIKEYFGQQFDFYMTGYANATTSQQLFNFDQEMSMQGSEVYEQGARNWLEAFQRLKRHIDRPKDKRKKIIFIDELPWFDTHGSDFMIGLEHFWNGWAARRRDIVLIVCGSAASWMINELIGNTGGLHNRVTHRMRILPFTLAETESLLQSRHCVFDRYQILQLYMCLGGIPYYLEGIAPGLSATQAIQQLLFDPNGRLHNEFYNLYRSLFRKHEVYETVVRSLATKTKGMSRLELIAASKIKSGGTLTKVLVDLEESGFITSYAALDLKNKNTLYRLSDYYTHFFFSFIAPVKKQKIQHWDKMIDQPSHRAWQGFTFEQVCMDHISAIKTSLGISGIDAHHVTWSGTSASASAQVDLVIDRRDHVINLCECKFSIGEYVITKAYAEELRKKESVFRAVTQTKKAIHTVLITTYGVAESMYKYSTMQREVTMDDLFLQLKIT
jgi:uncharacterized protein